MNNEYQHDGYSIEQQLSCLPLDVAWGERPLPRPVDVFVGHPMAAQRMALVDMTQLHKLVQERDEKIADLTQRLHGAHKMIEAGSNLRDQLFVKINQKREVCAAQTMFLYRAWGEHPGWSKEDAHRAMLYYVEHAVSTRPVANQLLRDMLHTKYTKHTLSSATLSKLTHD